MTSNYDRAKGPIFGWINRPVIEKGFVAEADLTDPPLGAVFSLCFIHKKENHGPSFDDICLFVDSQSHRFKF